MAKERPRRLAATIPQFLHGRTWQAGIGPFLGVFLLAHGWQSGPIGTVMTIGGVAGMLVTAPAGALVDGTTRKRSYVIIPGNMHRPGLDDHPALAELLGGGGVAGGDRDRPGRP